MIAKLEQNPALLTTAHAQHTSHLLIVLPKADKLDRLERVPFVADLQGALKRRKKKLDDLAKSPLVAQVRAGTLVAWVMDAQDKSVFDRQTLFRKGLQALLAENPT